MKSDHEKNNPPKNESQKIEAPTVGRLIWVYMKLGATEVPAIVQAVDGSLTVQAVVFDDSGIDKTELQHRSEAAHTPYWDWMPYQKGQAKKAEQLEQKLESELQKMAKVVAPAADRGGGNEHLRTPAHDTAPGEE